MANNFTRLLIALFFVCFSPIEAQIGGSHQNVKVVDRTSMFPSQVAVEAKLVYHPVGLTQLEAREVEEYVASTNNKLQLPEPITAFRGSGTILDRRWILTAAHLFANLPKPVFRMVNEVPRIGEPRVVRFAPKIDEVSVMIGQLDRTNGRNRHAAEHVRIHGGYGGGKNNDIALIQLKNPLNEPVNSLPVAPIDPSPGTACKIVGWGRHVTSRYVLQKSSVLRWANTRIVAKEERWENLTDDLLLVGQPRRQVANQPEYERATPLEGDSGSGLICEHDGRDTLFGVCQGFRSKKTEVKGHKVRIRENELGSYKFPSFYTNVHHHRAWIQNVMNNPSPEGSCKNNLVSKFQFANGQNEARSNSNQILRDDL